MINFNLSTIKSRNSVSKLIKKNSKSETGPLKKMPSILHFSSTIDLISLHKRKDVKKKYSIDCQKFYERGHQTNVEVTTRSSRWNLTIKLTESSNGWKSSLKGGNKSDLKAMTRRQASVKRRLVWWRPQLRLSGQANLRRSNRLFIECRKRGKTCYRYKYLSTK